MGGPAPMAPLPPPLPDLADLVARSSLIQHIGQ